MKFRILDIVFVMAFVALGLSVHRESQVREAVDGLHSKSLDRSYEQHVRHFDSNSRLWLQVQELWSRVAPKIPPKDDKVYTDEE